MDSKHAEIQWLLQYLKAPSKSVELVAKEHNIDLNSPRELTDTSVETKQKLTLRLYLLHLQAPELIDKETLEEHLSTSDIDSELIHEWLTALKAPLSEYEAVCQFLTPPSPLEHIHQLLFPRALLSFGHISPSRYRHDEDLKTTQRLEKKHSFSSLARWISEQLTEHAFEIRNNASAVRITEEQFPDLHQRYCSVSSRLGIDSPPPLYLSKGPVNAFTGGVEEPFLVIQEGMITQLTEREQEFVLGHELGHVLFSHMLLHMIAQLSVIQGALFAPNILIGRILAHGLGIQVKSWSRYAELSCDRAGLLACQDINAATHVLLRFAGVPHSKLKECNIEALLAQREVFETRKEESLGFLFSGIERSHPWVVERLYELLDWAKSEDYKNILSEAKPLIDLESQPSIDAELELLCLQAQLCKAHPRHTNLLREECSRKVWVLGTHPELSLINSQIYDLDICELTDEEASPADSFLVLDSDHDTSINLTEWSNTYNTQCFFYLNEIQQAQSNLPVSTQDPNRTSVFKWLRLQRESSFSSDTHRHYWRTQLAPEALKDVHKKASQLAIALIKEQFEPLAELSWFEKLSPEERLHAGKERLIEQLTQIEKNAAELYKRTTSVSPANLSSKRLKLKHKFSSPSPLEKITGIGTLAFGALLLPSTPMWLLVSAAGIGASSMATGEYLRQKSINNLLNDQLAEIRLWLEESKELLCDAFAEQEAHWIKVLDGLTKS